MSDVSAAVPRRLKVAALMDTHIVSGPGRQLAASIPPLRAAGVEVMPLLFHRRPRPVSAYRDYLMAQGLPFLLVEESGRADVRLVSRVASALREYGPDIVQTHSYRPTTLTWLLRAWRTQPWRWVGFFHGLTSENATVRAYHALDRRLLARADRVVVVARPQLALFAHCAGRVRVLPNAMLPGRPLSPDAAAVQLIEGLPRPRISVVGRLSHEKGADLFLHAIATILREGIEVSAILAGDGPERPALECLAQELGIRERVTFLGHLADPDAVYAGSDLVVLPSRSEGMPNALLEALVAGRPVVSTDAGAVPDIMALAGTAVGSMVPREDVVALAAAIQYELRRQPVPEAVHGRQLVLARYDLSHRVGALRALYEEVLSTP